MRRFTVQVRARNWEMLARAGKLAPENFYTIPAESEEEARLEALKNWDAQQPMTHPDTGREVTFLGKIISVTEHINAKP
jgi:hypothetical protein